MRVKEFYFCLLYVVIGQPSEHRERGEQVKDAYWLISMLQGVNLYSLLFLLLAYFQYTSVSKIIFFGLFFTPFAINYFLFLKQGEKRIIEQVDELLKKNKLKPRSYVIWYIIFTIIFMVLSSTIYYVYR